MITLNGDGTVTFRLYAPRADHVELLGDFTKWEHGRLDLSRETDRHFAGPATGPASVEDEPTGWWAIRMHVPAGDHAFCYLVDGHCWMPDYAAGGVKRNEYGNWVSLICVARATAAPVGIKAKAIEASVPGRDAETAADAHPDREHALVRATGEDATRESWRIEGCCDAVHPW